MKNACTRKVLISSARTRAIRTRNGSSRMNDERRFGFRSACRPAPPVSRGASSAAVDAGASSGVVTAAADVRSARRSGVALLLDLRLLAAQLAQVVELGPAHVAARHQLDVVDDRRVDGERPLDA